MRRLALAAAAVLALGAAIALVVERVTREETPAAAPAAEAPAPGEAPGTEAEPGAFDPFQPGGLQPPPAAPPPPEEFTAGSAPDLAAAGTRLPPVPAKEPWVSVPLRPRELRTLWIEISSLRAELPSCWADEPRAALSLNGGASKRLSPEGAPAALILEIESKDGVLRVVDSSVESLGDDRRATAECARAQLKGLSFKLPRSLDGSAIARSGTRARMRFVLQ